MELVYNSPCPYTGFIPYDYPQGFVRSWTIEERLNGLKEIYKQRLREGLKEKYPDYRELERKAYLKNRFEEFRDSVIGAIRRSSLKRNEKISAEDRIGELYGSFLKNLGFIDETGGVMPSFEALPEDYEYAADLERNNPQKDMEELDLSSFAGLFVYPLSYDGISGEFRRGFLIEEVGC